MRRAWTSEEVVRLRSLVGTMTTREMAAVMDRSRDSILNKLDYLKMATTAPRQVDEWTEDQILALRSVIENRSGATTAAQLTGKSVRAIYKKAKRLNLTFGRSTWWTKTEEEFIRETAGTLTALQLADKLGRGDKTIRWKAQEMGVDLKSGKPLRKEHFSALSRWTPEQVQALRDFAPTLNLSEMAAKVGRSERAVVHKLSSIHIVLLGQKKYVKRGTAIKPVVKVKTPVQRKIVFRGYVSRLAYCPVCHSPVVNTWERWREHNERLGCTRRVPNQASLNHQMAS